MKQRRSRKQHVAMSLFPFLSVLMSTMGALLVLLVMVMQKARTDGATISAQRQQQDTERSATQESLQRDKEVHDWRRQVLEKQRSELQQTLAGQRLALSNLEEHIRGLERDWKKLSTQATELQNLSSTNEKDQATAANELARLESEMDTASRKLADAKAKAQERTRSFAIVPYEGPNGTRRRPVFVECTDEGIILQPEGIVLGVRDFEGDLGPGNPLDAALRATREYLMRVGDTKVYGEPYPLLVVRPNGTVAYGVARAAIRAWDDEFGYELVDAEMRLEYPPPDASLRRELEHTIADARQRQSILAAVMPGRYQQRSGRPSGLVPSSHGGFEAVGGDDSLERSEFAPRGNSGGGSFSSVFGPPPGPNGNAILGTPASLASSGSSVYPRGTGSGGTGTFRGPGNSPDAGQASGAPGAARPNTFGSPPQGSVPSPTRTAGTGSPNFAPGGAMARNPGASGAGSAGAGNVGQQGGRQGSGQAIAGSPATGRTAPLGCKPLAATRGENWGLPNSTPTATGFTRSIRVQCLGDQLRILPETGDFHEPVVIATPEGVAPAVDSLVTAIWKRTESWGIAAEGGYWKPVLRVEVAPNAEQRFSELQTLLDGSGLPVQRK